MDDPERSRRRVLHLLGAGILGSVAGCGGESTPDESGDETEMPVTTTAGHDSETVTDQANELPPGKLVPPGGDEDDNFGNAVSLSGDAALVGAIRDDAAGGSWSGAAYVCTRADGTWSVRPKLTLSNGDAYDRFGNDVALSGDRGLVGAFHDSDHGKRAGAAYVFERTGDGAWTQEATLVPDDGKRRDNFGSSVTLDGERAVVGAAAASNQNGEQAGAAYVFERRGDAWSQRATLTPEEGDEGDRFGYEIAQSGSVLAIASPFDEDPNGRQAGSVSVLAIASPFDEDPNGRQAGSVSVFSEGEDGAWSQRAKLVPDDGDAGDQFGRSVDLDGRRLVVGAPFDEDPHGTDAGSAYLFRRADGTWSQQAKLTVPEGIEGDQFGQAVAVAGDTVLVGGGAGPDFDAAHEGRSMPGDGAGYVARFERTTDGWRFEGRITAPDGDAEDRFGVSVDLQGETALVGATGDEDPNGDGAGAAYVCDLK